MKRLILLFLAIYSLHAIDDYEEYLKKAMKSATFYQTVSDASGLFPPTTPYLDVYKTFQPLQLIHSLADFGSSFFTKHAMCSPDKKHDFNPSPRTCGLNLTCPTEQENCPAKESDEKNDSLLKEFSSIWRNHEILEQLNNAADIQNYESKMANDHKLFQTKQKMKQSVKNAYSKIRASDETIKRLESEADIYNLKHPKSPLHCPKELQDEMDMSEKTAFNLKRKLERKTDLEEEFSRAWENDQTMKRLDFETNIYDKTHPTCELECQGQQKQIQSIDFNQQTDGAGKCLRNSYESHRDSFLFQKSLEKKQEGNLPQRDDKCSIDNFGYNYPSTNPSQVPQMYPGGEFIGSSSLKEKWQKMRSAFENLASATQNLRRFQRARPKRMMRRRQQRKRKTEHAETFDCEIYGLLFPDSNQCQAQQPLERESQPFLYSWETLDTFYGAGHGASIPSSEPTSCPLNPDWEDAAVYPDAPDLPTSSPVFEPSAAVTSTVPTTAKQFTVDFQATLEPTDTCKTEFKNCIPEFGFEYEAPGKTDLTPSVATSSFNIPSPVTSSYNEYIWDTDDDKFLNAFARDPAEQVWNEVQASSHEVKTKIDDAEFWDWFESDYERFYSEFGHYVEKYPYYKGSDDYPQSKQSGKEINMSYTSKRFWEVANDADVEQKLCFPEEETEEREDADVFWIGDYMEADDSDVWSSNATVNKMDPANEALFNGQKNVRWV